MKKAFLGLLFTAASFAADVLVIKVGLGIPGLPYVPGFAGMVQVYVKPDAGHAVRVTVQTAAGPMTAEGEVSPWYGYACVVFPVADIIGVPEIEELR